MDKLLTFGALKADSRYYSLDSGGVTVTTTPVTSEPLLLKTPEVENVTIEEPTVVAATPEINLGKITEEKPQPESNLEENQVAAKLAEYFSKNPDELQSIIEKAKKG
jgi:hypothetical protein